MTWDRLRELFEEWDRRIAEASHVASGVDRSTIVLVIDADGCRRWVAIAA